MAIEKELVHAHKFHPRHFHFHPPHHTSSGGILTVLGASMLAHPIGWAIGALIVVGVVGVVVYNALKED